VGIDLSKNLIMDNFLSLSELLRLNYAKRSSDSVPKYPWKKYFNSDYTFSPYRFKKIQNNENVTAGVVRNQLLSSMIARHHSLYKDSDDYKGQVET
jgi:hypothetical protein